MVQIAHAKTFAVPARIIAALSQSHPQSLTADEVFNAAYKGCDDLPSQPRKTLQVQIAFARRALRGTGWRIPTQKNGRGAAMNCRYRLEQEGVAA